MTAMQPSERREIAAAELARRCPHLQPLPLVDSLSHGLTQLRDLLVKRLHRDVELQFGTDTMIGPLSPASEVKQVIRASQEFDVYAAVVVNEEVQRGLYVDRPGHWFLDWLVQLRMNYYAEADLAKRLESYLGHSQDECRLRFVSNLQAAVPESLRTPLVLFQLVPLAVRIVVATAFGDERRAQQLRAEQIEILPAIAACDDCQGRVLGNETRCHRCGNPIWTFDWLRET